MSKQYLDEWLKDKKVEGFSSTPHYFEDGDYISLFFNDERCYAVQVNDFLTVFRSDINDSFVGCKIHNVSNLIKK